MLKTGLDLLIEDASRKWVAWFFSNKLDCN